jgi:hypothetical protein
VSSNANLQQVLSALESSRHLRPGARVASSIRRKIGNTDLNTVKKLFFWNYARNTWQWDVLCAVILVFIFVTPKSWFENGERRDILMHQSPTASTLVVSPELVENAQDRSELERRVKAFTGRDDATVVDIRKVADKDGHIRAYEVDIH